MKIEYIKNIFLNKIYIGLNCLEIKLDKHGIEKDIDNIIEIVSNYKTIYIRGDLKENNEIQKIINKVSKKIIDIKFIIETNSKEKYSFKGNVEYFINCDIVDYNDDILNFYNNRCCKFLFYSVDEFNIYRIFNFIKNYNLKKDKIYISLQNMNYIKLVKANEYNLLFYINNLGDKNE